MAKIIHFNDSPIETSKKSLISALSQFEQASHSVRQSIALMTISTAEIAHYLGDPAHPQYTEILALLDALYQETNPQELAIIREKAVDVIQRIN